MRALKKFIKRIIPNCILKQFYNRSFSEETIIYRGVSYKEFLTFVYPVLRPGLSKAEERYLLSDMKWTYITKHVRPDEFLLFNFDKKSREEREKYMSQMNKDSILIEYYIDNWNIVLGQLKNKFEFYKLLKPFFKRDAIKISSMEDLDALESFCKKYNRVIRKPLKDGCGVGVSLIEVNNIHSLTDVCVEMISQGEFIIEELIEQDEVMSALNTSSINTVRLPSFRHGQNVVPAYPLLRIGREGSLVDNAAQGGIFASVDVNTGVVITDGYDELGHRYDRHPDSNIKLKGLQIPQWKELLQIAQEIHLSLPDAQTYVGFDFAFSKNGWVLVEGNWGDFYMMEIALQKGLKEEFISLLYNKTK